MGILAIPAAIIVVLVGGSIIVGLGEWLFNRGGKPKPSGGVPVPVIAAGMLGFWLIFWLVLSAVIN